MRSKLAAIVVLAALFSSLPAWRASASDCTKTSVGLIPLNDLGTRLYKGKQGGLYPGGTNARPAAHESVGLALARSIRPLDANGRPDDNGKLVLVSIGMSNTTQEFSTFKPMADLDPAKNPKLVIVDGAQGGMSADRISDLNTSSAQQFWSVVDTRLRAAGVTPAQLQIAWIKQADPSPSAEYPSDALKLKDELARIAQILKTRFPNILLVYCSSRTYGGYASTNLNPEPFAYQSGFAVKWLMEDQINGSPDLNFDPSRGAVRAPWLAWGPYLWADGLTSRSDGLTYACSDFVSDGTHPAQGGAREKVAQLLLDFLKNDSTARLWFLAVQASGAYSLYYPRLAGPDGSSSPPHNSESLGIAVANLGSGNATLTFTAFDTGGSLIAGPNISNPRSLELKAGEQLAQLDFELFGAGLPARNATGWIKLDSTSGKTTGFFLAFDNTLSVLDGADVSTGVLSSAILPEIEDQGFTQINVANPNNEPVTVTFELYKSDGTPGTPAPAVRNLNTNGALAVFINDLFPGVTASGSDYVKLTANRAVVPFEYMGKTGQYVKALNGQDASAGVTTLYSPQYVVGGPDWRSTLSVVNLDSSSGTVAFRFVSDEGIPIGATQIVPLPARGKIAITDQTFFVDAGSRMMQGYVEIRSSGPRLAGSVVFGDRDQRTFSSALPLVSRLQTSMAFSHVASNETYFMGLAFLNPNDTEAAATIEVYESSGTRVASKVEVLPARRRKSQLLTQYFPDLAGQKRSSGYVKVTSDRPIAGFALFGTHSLSVLSAVPAQSVP